MAKPVIAAVNGVAAGAGASLAFACDLRLVADTAGFNLAFANVALSCDTGASYHLPILVGRAKALELLYFPRTVKADEALDLGLATRVVPADELAAEAASLAAQLAAGPTVALGSIRQSVAYSADHTFTEALEFESSMMQRSGATEDHQRAVAAFIAKEKPTFEGRWSPAPAGPSLTRVCSAVRRLLDGAVAAPGAEDPEHPLRSHLAHRPAAGVGAVLDGEGVAAEPVVVPAGHRAVTDPAAVEGLRRQAEHLRHAAGEAAVLRVGVDAVQRLVEAEDVVGAHRATGSPSSPRSPAPRPGRCRTRSSRPGRPSGRGSCG